MKIITYIELEVIDQEILDSKIGGYQKTSFIVEMFPCEVPQFLVPFQIFESKKACFDKLMA